MNSTEDLPPSLGERYSSACFSSNLRMSERWGDVDLLIAAGLAASGQNEDDPASKLRAAVAMALYRLLGEYDTVRADHRAAEQRMHASEDRAKRQPRDDAGSARAEKIMMAGETDALTAHVFILAQMPSLRETKDLFGRYAIAEATRQQFMRPDKEVLILAGQVLDVVLSPKCRHCGGRGSEGGGRHEQSGAQVICRPCKGSGSRRDSIGKDDMQRIFANRLQMQASALMYQADRDLRAGRNIVEEAKRKIAEQTEMG